MALLEYDNIEGMIIPNEFSKIGNMRLALKSIKVGKQEIVLVLRVDAEKGYFYWKYYLILLGVLSCQQLLKDLDISTSSHRTQGFEEIFD